MFQPLTMLRVLMEDRELTTTELAVLMVAVLHTGDRRDPTKHNQVCMDQAGLAEDAKVSLSTIKRVYRSKEFRKYFEITDEYHRGRRWVVLRWVTPGVMPGVTVTPHLSTCSPDTSSTASSASASTTSTPVTSGSFMHMKPMEFRPKLPQREDYDTYEEYFQAEEQYTLDLRNWVQSCRQTET